MGAVNEKRPLPRPDGTVIQLQTPVGIPEPPQVHKSRLRHGADVIRQATIPWLVDQVIHETGVGQLAAPEDTGKSIVAVDLALSVANGLKDWAGYEIVRPGPVVYVAMEGGPVIQSYIDAWLKYHPGTDLENFYILDEEIFTFGDAVVLAEFERDLLADGVDPVLFIFDTQIDVMGDEVDENGVQIGHMFRGVRGWSIKHNAFSLLLHHASYDTRRGRGSTSIRGKCDVMAFLDKKTNTFEWQKIKGNRKPAPFPFEITGVVGSTGACVIWPDTAGLSRTEGAQRGFDTGDKDIATQEAILDILESQSNRMQLGKAAGWSNSEICNALKGLRASESDPHEVHVSPKYVSPVLECLSRMGLIVDKANAAENGKGFQWRLAEDG